MLAPDVAIRTGCYSQHENGTWNIQESKRSNGNKMHGAFRVMLDAVTASGRLWRKLSPRTATSTTCAASRYDTPPYVCVGTDDGIARRAP